MLGTAAHVGTAHTATTDHVRFLCFLYGNQPGYLEVCICPGDPRTTPVRRAGWHWYDPQHVHELAAHLSSLAARYGNVYVSRSLYRSRHRRGSEALPSAVVFLDDAPEQPAQPYSAVVRTSAASRHAYYRLAQAAEPEVIKELQQRAAAALGADRSGADVTQLVRVPASRNTKDGKDFPVQLEQLSDATYTPEQLRAAWPASVQGSTEAAELDWAQVEGVLGDVERLLGPDGIPRRLSHHSQARRLLEGTLTAPSTSDARAIVCRGLILHGYPDEEAAALLLHLCDYGAAKRKGRSWLARDVARLIGKERARHPGVDVKPSFCRGTQPAARYRRTKRGRPRALSAEELLAWYMAQMTSNGVVLLTRHEVAEALAVSVATIDRLERQLRASGALERRTVPSRRYSYVVILGAVKNAPELPAPAAQPAHSDSTEQRIPMPQTDDQPDVKEEHTAPRPSPSSGGRQSPTLTALVRDALAQCPGRVSFARVRTYVHATSERAYAVGLIKRVYATELADRQRAKLDARIAAMTRRELCGFIRGCKRNIQRSLERSDRSWRYWRIPLSKAQARLAQLRFPTGACVPPAEPGGWGCPPLPVGSLAPSGVGPDSRMPGGSGPARRP